MEGFKFSLQDILNISINEEDEAKNRFEALMIELTRLKNTLRDLNTTIALNSSISNIEDIGVLHLKRNYLTSLELQKETLLKSIEVKEKEVNDAQKDYVDKQIDRQLIENIRDNELKEYLIMVDMEEQARNDEFAIYSYVKNQS